MEIKTRFSIGDVVAMKQRIGGTSSRFPERERKVYGTVSAIKIDLNGVFYMVERADLLYAPDREPHPEEIQKHWVHNDQLIERLQPDQYNDLTKPQAAKE